MTELTDGDLVQRVRDGDAASYSTLVSRYQGHVYGLAYSLVNSWADAQDIAQETFIRAYVNLDQLREAERFAAWLRRVAFSVAMKWLRTFRPSLFAQLDGQVDLESLEIPDFAPGPQEVVERKELAEAVQRAIQSLPPKYRVPLTMFHLDGLSFQKVADFLDVPLGTAKSLIHRAREKLRVILGAYYSEEIGPMVHEVFAEHKLPVEFSGKVMAQADGHRQDSFSLVVQAAARLLGRELDYDAIAALSTNPFALGISPAEDCPAWWHMYGRGANLDLVASRLGLHVHRLELPPSESSIQQAYGNPAESAKYRFACVPSLREALSKGEVVITPGGWEIRGAHGFTPWCWWGLITEVREDGTILGACLNGEPDNRLEVVQEFWALSKAEKAVSVVAADAEMLRRAIRRIRGEIKATDVADVVHGLPAMDLWIAQMSKTPFCPNCAKKGPGGEVGCAYSTALVVSEGAKVAARYLRTCQASFREKARPQLKAAAQSYDRIVHLLSPALTGNSGNSYHQIMGDLDKQKAHAQGVLCKIRDELARAAEEMEKALT